MTTYEFEIPGEPVAKARPRAAARGNHVIMYTPTKSKSFEFYVRNLVSKEIPIPLDGPISVTIELELPRPKRLCWKTKPMQRVYCDVRPDIDNFCKSILDGLNGIAFKDDGQVAELHARKYYHSGNGHPKTNILIRTL